MRSGSRDDAGEPCVFGDETLCRVEQLGAGDPLECDDVAHCTRRGDSCRRAGWSSNPDPIALTRCGSEGHVRWRDYERAAVWAPAPPSTTSPGSRSRGVDRGRRRAVARVGQRGAVAVASQQSHISASVDPRRYAYAPVFGRRGYRQWDGTLLGESPRVAQSLDRLPRRGSTLREWSTDRRCSSLGG